MMEYEIICQYCGTEGEFETEEDTGKVYCVFCGHYTGAVVELYMEEY